MKTLPKRIRDRFLAKFHTSSGGCWEWKGHVNNAGYGVLCLGKGRRMGAHRASWLVFKGPILESLCVLHRCDNRKCVRPTHLFLGTCLDNIADMVIKNRQRGARRLLSNSQLVSIQKDGRSQRIIAREYGISQPYVSQIKRRICARKGFDYKDYWRRYRRSQYESVN